MPAKQRKYVQFSKKVVVAVTAAVTIICAVAIFLCWTVADAGQIVNVTRTYIEYAMVVFVAYSGNSAVEKWLIHRGSTDIETEDSSNQDKSNG